MGGPPQNWAGTVDAARIATMRPRYVGSTLVLLSLSGCAAAARDVAREATPGVVEGSVEALTDRQLQRQVVEGIDERTVADATHRLVSGVVDGTLRSVEDPQRRAELQQQLGALGAGVTNSAGDIVDESVARLTSEPNQAKMREAAQGFLSEAITGGLSQARAELSKTDLTGLGGIARELSKQAALGVQDAVEESQAKQQAGQAPPDKGNVLAAAGEAVEKGPNVLWIAIAGIVAFAFALLGTILWAGRRQRTLQAELHRRDDALLGLVASIAGRDRPPTFGELEQALGNLGHRDAARQGAEVRHD